MTTTQAISAETQSPLFQHLSVEKMPAHWLMARLGKRVLRPGGLETTRWLLERARISGADDVVEFAPGLGVTAREILQRHPRSYTGVEREATAKAVTEHRLSQSSPTRARVIEGDASKVPLPDGSATLVVGEAMLSMQPADKKRAIVGEAHRLLRSGGRYAIHELAVQRADIDPAEFATLQSDLGRCIHVGVRIGTIAEWTRWLGDSGFEVEQCKESPMRLLEPDRIVRDEGYAGAVRFMFNVLRTPGARKRLFELRRVFRQYQSSLCAVALVARRL